MKFLLIICLLFLALSSISSSFHYSENGANWSSKEWQCLSGSSQSPINIDNSSISENDKYLLILQKASGAAGINIANNGHSIQADNSWIKFQATNVEEQVKSYSAIQMHFHSPSEHSFDGKLQALEIHIVSDQIDGPNNGLTKGVLALLFDVDEKYEDNPLVEPFSQVAKKYASSSDVKTMKIDANFYENFNQALSAYQADGVNYYTYQGSLTTPPCTEIIEWYVIKQSLPISTRQLKHFQDLWENNKEFAEGKGNNRMVQSLNGRKIVQGIVLNELQPIQVKNRHTQLFILHQNYQLFFIKKNKRPISLIIVLTKNLINQINQINQILVNFQKFKLFSSQVIVIYILMQIILNYSYIIA